MGRLGWPPPRSLDRGHPDRAGRVLADLEPRAVAWFPRRPLLADRSDRDRAAGPGSPPVGWLMSRNRGLLFPLILIAIGVVVLLANTGVVSREALERLGVLGPLLLVILGLQLILNHTLPRRPATLIGLAVAAVLVIAAVAYATLAPATSFGAQKADATAQIGGLTAATLDLNYSAASVDVKAGSLGDTLYQVHVDYPGGENPPTINLDHESGRLAIRESASFSPFHLFGSNRRHISLVLTARIPWKIELGGGAANPSLDLPHLQLTELDISRGANRP